MQFVKIPVTTLETLIDELQSAVNVCYNVDSTSGNCEKTYPYATGYSRSAMENIIKDLKYLKTQAK